MKTKRLAMAATLGVGLMVGVGGAHAQLLDGLVNAAVDGVVNAVKNEITPNRQVATTDKPFTTQSVPSRAHQRQSSSNIPAIQTVNTGHRPWDIVFDTLPLDKWAFKRVKGDGSRAIAIISDPGCPYSKRLEQSLQEVDNITIYTIPAALAYPNAEPMVTQVWCQGDNASRVKAWEDYMLHGKQPPKVANCPTPHQSMKQALSRLVNDNGNYYADFAPILAFPKNYTVNGYIPSDLIERVILIDSQRD